MGAQPITSCLAKIQLLNIQVLYGIFYTTTSRPGTNTSPITMCKLPGLLLVLDSMWYTKHWSRYNRTTGSSASPPEHIHMRTTNRQQNAQIQYLWKQFCCNTPQQTAATPELHLASDGLAVAPRPSHTAVLLWYIPGNIPHPFLVDMITIHSYQIFYSQQTIPHVYT